jgi:outer membrane protein OmpA-like peptidoglycan-associated protein
VQNGVAPGRLTARGYGATRPIADNKTPAGREQNRRVQFVILDPKAVGQTNN